MWNLLCLYRTDKNISSAIFIKGIQGEIMFIMKYAFFKGNFISVFPLQQCFYDMLV